MELIHTTLEMQNGVALATFNRPERLNAFTREMLEDLLKIYEFADMDDSVRAVVVTGAGRAFCAGADLGEGEKTFDYAKRYPGEDSIAKHRDGGGKVSLAAFNCRKPVIAAINGPAVGVGITLTLAMDMRIVAEDAKIGFVFARRGVVLEACSSWFLPRLVGMSKAAELAYTARVFKAREEAGSGLFNYVLPADQVLPKAMEIARDIADNTSGMSVAMNKALLANGWAQSDPHAQHLLDSKAFYWAGMQADAKEGITAFLEKRAPKFTVSPSKDMPDFYSWWREPKS